MSLLSRRLLGEIVTIFFVVLLRFAQKTFVDTGSVKDVLCLAVTFKFLTRRKFFDVVWVDVYRSPKAKYVLVFLFFAIIFSSVTRETVVILHITFRNLFMAELEIEASALEIITLVAFFTIELKFTFCPLTTMCLFSSISCLAFSAVVR